MREKLGWGGGGEICASAYQPRTRHSVLGVTLFIKVAQRGDATGWGVRHVSRGDKRLLVASICPGDHATCRHNMLTSEPAWGGAFMVDGCTERRVRVSLTRRNAAALKLPPQAALQHAAPWNKGGGAHTSCVCWQGASPPQGILGEAAATKRARWEGIIGTQLAVLCWKCVEFEVTGDW